MVVFSGLKETRAYSERQPRLAVSENFWGP